MSISELARQLGMNRNSVAKYLEILLLSGEVETKAYGTSRIYALSQRVPVSAMMSFSSDMIIMIDQDGRIVQVNNPFLQFTGLSPELLIGQYFTHNDIIILRELPVQELLTGSS